MTGLETKLATTVGTYLAKNFAGRIVERWTKYRSDQMLEGLVAGLSEEKLTGNKTEVDRILSRILEHEKYSEALFDAYRRICFSKSKTIGPRIVGYLTARIIAEQRVASDGDEEIFDAAERLGDGDLIAFINEYHDQASKADKESTGLAKPEWDNGAIIIPWYDTQFYSNHGSYKGEDISPLDLGKAYGRWAGELGRIGLMTTLIKRGMIDYESGPAETYEFIVRFERNCKNLSDLILRCLPPKNEEA
jgi:hypothetical protein